MECEVGTSRNLAVADIADHAENDVRFGDCGAHQVHGQLLPHLLSLDFGMYSQISFK